MKDEKVEYHPKFEDLENKSKEDKINILEMIDEGGPVHVERVLKDKEENEESKEEENKKED